MVPITRSADANALEHILSIVLSEPPLSPGSTTIPPFRACFTVAGVSTASDFISIDPSMYGSVSFSILASGDDPQSFTIIQVKKINSLFSWYRQVDSPTISRWFELDDSIFQAWRTQAPPSAPIPSYGGSSKPHSAISDFRKSVKRSVADYNTFKEDCLWHSWNRHLLTTARSHNVDNVLNLSYIPPTPDDLALLNEQKRFVFSVLEQKVQTSDGLVFIRIHSDTGDASAI